MHTHAPCDGGPAAPAFVGSDYFCEEGPYKQEWIGDYFTKQGPGQATMKAECRTGFGEKQTWFESTLDSPTNDDFTLQVMSDQARSNEDIGITELEIWVKAPL